VRGAGPGWAIRLFAAPVVAPYWEPTTALMQMLFRREHFEDGQSGALCSSVVDPNPK
jgi:hypothetical protein